MSDQPGSAPMDDNPLALALADIVEADRRLAQAIITLMRHTIDQDGSRSGPSHEMTLESVIGALQFHHHGVQRSRDHVERLLRGACTWSDVGRQA